MADLIIKPATGAGNKLILQDKAGGAVLTTADSGATVANVTLDNATQDSITRLGTVTTGTIKNTIHTDTTWPAGVIINHKQFKSTAGVDYTGTTETVYSGLGTMTFAKKKDASTSKLFFHSHGKMFDSVGSSLSMGFKLRKGTNTSGTQVGICDAYDLHHGGSSPYRTGRDLSMPCNEVTDLGVGNHDFVITCTRNGYADPTHCAYWHVHIFEIAI